MVSIEDRSWRCCLRGGRVGERISADVGYGVSVLGKVRREEKMARRKVQDKRCFNRTDGPQSLKVT